MGRHLLIVNSHAGGGRAPARVRELLAGINVPGEQFDAVFTEAPGHAARLAEDAAPRCDTLVAVGGDGTVGEVATGLLASGSETACLGILPFGTGNDAALTLGIPDWDAGLAAIRSGSVRKVDIFDVAHQAPDGPRTRRALIGVGIGAPAEVIAMAGERVKHLLGRWGYFYAAVLCGFSYRCPRMRIETDGTVREGQIPLVAIASMEWSGGHTLRMAPGALCDDGWLDVVIAREPNSLRLVRRLPHVMDGSHVKLPEVEYFRAQHISVESDPPARITIDGDLSGTTPVQIEVVPGALRVRTPL